MLKPGLPAYDIGDWRRRPFPERLRLVCQSWASQGYGTPSGVYLLYLAKIVLYCFGWAWFCTFTPGFELGNIGSWWASDTAFVKAVVWTMLFEGLGFVRWGSHPTYARVDGRTVAGHFYHKLLLPRRGRKAGKPVP